MGGALKSIEGVRVITAPKVGTGESATTMTVIELSGKASMAKVLTAIEECKTPHASEIPPGVAGFVPLKLKADVTPEKFVEALRKAGLLDED